MKLKAAVFSLILASSLTSHAEALLWKSSKPAKKTTSRFNYDRTEEAREVGTFWENRKMGVGVASVGAYGLIGGVVAFQFHPQWGVDLGFGGGSHFQSFGFRVRKMLLLSSPFNPYFALGFQRWQRTTSRPFNAADVSPGYVASEFLSEEERRLGIIDQKLIHGTLGLQYVFTSGEWKSYGLFLEAVYLISAEDLDSAPTASLGFNYFF